ncbi:HK97-gp10 family putative phage morphogenesis protein [Streptomonospora wellingtoniae]|uniref:HK97 gp10 family phage protein n=1 Tax=Streptomonospora wellingtoniae TaxID=3075544 RepID=A0ABU2L0H9_9ACTN|nr:HK97-gp10 family putative phage morphogenesis protein [Streptomonospora sp. DSM 45055]MDT0305064.1 hypothetical protein [Streptomonospora sp. DSM 45055]
MSVRVIGARAARRALARLTTDMHDTMDVVAEKWADTMYEGAIADVPIDSGDLGSALEKRRSGSGATADAKVGVWEKDEYYGQFQEFGTSAFPAQPFMYPNAKKANKQIRGWVREEFEKKVEGG